MKFYKEVEVLMGDIEEFREFTKKDKWWKDYLTEIDNACWVFGYKVLFRYEDEYSGIRIWKTDDGKIKLIFAKMKREE